jgi:hypothetical protein
MAESLAAVLPSNKTITLDAPNATGSSASALAETGKFEDEDEDEDEEAENSAMATIAPWNSNSANCSAKP